MKSCVVSIKAMFETRRQSPWVERQRSDKGSRAVSISVKDVG
jgi:hypothetical protein